MEKSFWYNLKKPFFVLAPMADVTDVAFRSIIAKYSRHGESGGGPDVFWTEFVSADGLLSPGREVIKRDLEFGDNEHPIVAQIFGAKPENFTPVAEMVAEMGFDGIDINMGCPDRSVNKQGAGAALCKNPELAADIIRATKAGAGDLPVTAKIRIGWTKDETETWLPALLEAEPAVISIHARTRKDLSKVPPKWDAVKRAVEIRDEMGKDTLIVANGGILTHEQGEEVARYTGCDGIMMGKAIFGNPWLFDREKGEVTVEEKLRVMLEHTKLFLEKLGDIKSFAIMKKHYKAYVNGFPGAKELRIKLMAANSYEEIEREVEKFLQG
jgi:nifR3 family TIM-barrel protein